MTEHILDFVNWDIFDGYLEVCLSLGVLGIIPLLTGLGISTKSKQLDYSWLLISIDDSNRGTYLVVKIDIEGLYFFYIKEYKSS